jgi:hypothetical protein
MFNLLFHIMKKFLCLCFWAIIVVVVLSCNKTDIIACTDLPTMIYNKEINQNEATWINPDSTKFFPWVLRLKISLGHTASQCGNKCVYMFGEWMHLDCRGFGNVCKYLIRGILAQDEESSEFFFTFEKPDALGEDLEFLFPDRSFRFSNPLNSSDWWLNVPEQTLVRVSDTVPFVMHNVWFSAEQELENR